MHLHCLEQRIANMIDCLKACMRFPDNMILPQARQQNQKSLAGWENGSRTYTHTYIQARRRRGKITAKKHFLAKSD